MRNMPSSTTKRKFLMLEDNTQIIAQAEAGKKKARIVEEFKIAASPVSTILKNKDAITAAFASGSSAKCKMVTQPVHKDLKKAVFKWFVETWAKKIPISGGIVCEKALNYACVLGINDFKASVG